MFSSDVHFELALSCFLYFCNTTRLGINVTNLSTGRYVCGNGLALEEVIHPVLHLGRRGLCFHFYYDSISDLMFFRGKGIFFHRPVQTFKKDSAVAELLGMFEKIVTNFIFFFPNLVLVPREHCLYQDIKSYQMQR